MLGGIHIWKEDEQTLCVANTTEAHDLLKDLLAMHTDYMLKHALDLKKQGGGLYIRVLP